MLVFKLLTFLVICLCKEWANGIEINVLTKDDNSLSVYYNYICDSFNNYARMNNLDIEMSIKTYNDESYDGGDVLDSIIAHKTDIYDMYIFDQRDSANYADSLLNIYPHLSKQIDMYDYRIISNINVDGKITGLPLFLNYDVLYSNESLLSKYGKKAPQTWDDLFETAIYILEEENARGNTNLIGYNGLFTDDSIGASSIYEFIYSFRYSYNDKFPGFSSSVAYDALSKLKSLKENISSDNIFQSNEGFTYDKLFSENKNILFAKSVNIGEIQGYIKTSIPGRYEGISGSYVNGKYIGIPNFISDTKISASIEVLKFLTTFEMQKDFAIKFKDSVYLPIQRIYDSMEVCEVIDCTLMRELQPIFIPLNINYNVFEKKLVSSTYEYLYGDAPISQALDRIDYYVVYEMNDPYLNSPDDNDFEFDPLGTKASEECQAEVKKSMTCIEKIFSEIEPKSEYLQGLNYETVCMPSNEKTTSENCKTIVKQGLDVVCKVFEEGDECKDFIADDNVVNLINSGKCQNSQDDIALLGELAALKSAYLMGCKKSDSGKLCPIGQYATTTAIDIAFNNFKTVEKLAEQEYDNNNSNDFEAALDLGNDILALFPLLKDIGDILVESCTDASCNKNIIAIDKIILATKSAYEKSQNVDLTKQYPKVFELYDTYLNKYRNKQCEMFNFSSDNSSGATALKKITYSLVSMIVAASVLLLL